MSELGWYLGFELSLSLVMVLVTPVGYPLGYYINVLLVLALFDSFGIWEGYLVGFSLGILSGLMIFTGEVYLVGLSLVLLLRSPLDSPNPITELTVMLLGAPLGMWFVSYMVLGVGISCVPPSGYVITYKMNSVKCCQLLELITLSLSPTWLITNYVGILIAAELASTECIPFALVIDYDSYR